MPAIIDSAPACVAHVAGAKPADDSADFVLQAAYEKCASIGTFMSGSTYGEDGTGAATAYMVLVWLGIVVTVAVLLYWMFWENRRLQTWVQARRAVAPIPE